MHRIDELLMNKQFIIEKYSKHRKKLVHLVKRMADDGIPLQVLQHRLTGRRRSAGETGLMPNP